MDKKLYIIDLKKYDEKYLTEDNFNYYFNKNTLWQKIQPNESNVNIDFAHNETLKNLWNTHITISNNFTQTHYKYLTNKSSLYKTIQKLEPENYKKYMQFHVDIDVNNLEQYLDLFSDGKIFILRPTWGFARSGIQIFKKFDEFKDFMLKIGIKEYNHAKNKYKNELNLPIYVLSEYLQNQLTIKNRIFNFRVIFLISLVNNIYRAYLINPIMIHYAKKEHTNSTTNGDTNSDISSMISASGIKHNYIFDDLVKEIGKKNGKFIKQQIKHNLSYLFRIIKEKRVMENYKNVENSYQIFGLDFIADKDFNVKLIEFNDKTGLLNYSDDFYNILTAGYLYSTINKLYSPEYHIQIDKKIKKKIIRIRSNKHYL